ncbi:polyprenyl diphosphate synthase [Kutzneria albida]|uniref:Isoprenyl transferase n=1 Tax=Kutzneria albida DSM 43870 TaxID=1449976 RepID=W5WG83_9PSEU|nr:polyprenyl diphosphate synthase [Kutzneria albida]AHH97159.1 Undecaprenyl pyrophosphate synthase [Kutzneria albida DSM 43870]
MPITDPLHALYTRRLRKQVLARTRPQHVGLIMDGNRRWASQMGIADTRLGHEHGGRHVEHVLNWCETLGIGHVTVFVCSTENLLRRREDEVAFLMQVVEQVVTEHLTRPDTRWRMHVAGLLDVLPDTTAHALKQAVETTRHRTGPVVTLAIGYGGRQELATALRDLLHERAAEGQTLTEIANDLTPEDIASHLYTAGQPDPELIIRTSGEQRSSNFLLWQSANADLHFCEAYWPAFREIDFLRALRAWADRRTARS